MNERIKLLIEQATTYIDPIANDGVCWDFKVTTCWDFDKEKFAELIVAEMLQTCEDHPGWSGRMIGEQIKQDFGVEE